MNTTKSREKSHRCWFPKHTANMLPKPDAVFSLIYSAEQKSWTAPENLSSFLNFFIWTRHLINLMLGLRWLRYYKYAKGMLNYTRTENQWQQVSWNDASEWEIYSSNYSQCVQSRSGDPLWFEAAFKPQVFRILSKLIKLRKKKSTIRYRSTMQ